MTRQVAIRQLSEELCKMIIQLLDKNLRFCVNCDNFIQSTEICKLCNERPPAKIVAKGCEQWKEEDDIPF